MAESCKNCTHLYLHESRCLKHNAILRKPIRCKYYERQPHVLLWIAVATVVVIILGGITNTITGG